MTSRPARRLQIVGTDGRPLRLSAAYDGASTGRRINIRAPSGGPNIHLTAALQTLINRARQAYRNNPWIASAIERGTVNEIGTGIIPRAKTGDSGLNQAMLELWDDWAPEADADGVLDIYGLQSLASRNRRMAGEVFIRLRPRRLEDGLAVPLQVQVLESEHVPVTLNQVLPSGNLIRHGIEFDRMGRRTAYWMYRQHPGESTGFGLVDIGRTVRVPASMVIHHYAPQRPGQIRGEPEATRALFRGHVFEEYEDAELDRKKNKAQFTGFIRKPPMEYSEDDWKYNPVTGEPLTEDADGVPLLDVQPGTFPSLLPGEEIQFASGDDTGSGYADFQREQKFALAAALSTPYELLTGDYRNVNDRLIRAVLQEYRRQIEMIQDQITIQQVCRGVRNAWLEQAVLAGMLPISSQEYARNRRQYQRCEWRPQGWPYMHPEQDINAALAAISGGLSSRAAEVAKRGFDVEEVDQQNATDQQRAESLGLSYAASQPPAPTPEQSNE